MAPSLLRRLVTAVVALCAVAPALALSACAPPESQGAVSPAGMDVFGAPQVVAADGHHVVAAFFASTEDGFELVAASLEEVR